MGNILKSKINHLDVGEGLEYYFNIFAIYMGICASTYVNKHMWILI